MLLITEELFLLALDKEHGQVPNSIAMSLRFGLGGAILADLFAARRIRLESKNRVSVTNAGPADNDLLEEVLVIMRKADSPRKLTHWINLFSSGTKKFQARLGDRLVDKGI